MVRSPDVALAGAEAWVRPLRRSSGAGLEVGVWGCWLWSRVGALATGGPLAGAELLWGPCLLVLLSASGGLAGVGLSAGFAGAWGMSWCLGVRFGTKGAANRGGALSWAASRFSLM